MKSIEDIELEAENSLYGMADSSKEREESAKRFGQRIKSGSKWGESKSAQVYLRRKSVP